MSEELVEVGRYLDLQEAEVVKGLLESCGIAAQVFGDNQGNMVPYQAMVMPTRVLVPKRALDDAKAILAGQSTVEAQDERGDEEPPQQTGPKILVRRAVVAAFLGFLIVPVISQVYSLYLAQSAVKRWQDLTTGERRKLVLAVAFDLVVVGAAIVLFLSTR